MQTTEQNVVYMLADYSIGYNGDYVVGCVCPIPNPMIY